MGISPRRSERCSPGRSCGRSSESLTEDEEGPPRGPLFIASRARVSFDQRRERHSRYRSRKIASCETENATIAYPPEPPPELLPPDPVPPDPPYAPSPLKNRKYTAIAATTRTPIAMGSHTRLVRLSGVRTSIVASFPDGFATRAGAVRNAPHCT